MNTRTIKMKLTHWNMKWQKAISSDLDTPSLKFQNVFSSLKCFNRDELYSIINESNRLLSLECSEIPVSVPEELWRLIFFKASVDYDYLHQIKSSEKCFGAILASRQKMLQKLSCVSRSFSNYAHRLVNIWFIGSYHIIKSNWLFSHLPVEETSLCLSYNTTITESTLSKLTHLQSLNLDFSSKPITDSLVSQLSNLTQLSANDNGTITN